MSVCPSPFLSLKYSRFKNPTKQNKSGKQRSLVVPELGSLRLMRRKW